MTRGPRRGRWASGGAAPRRLVLAAALAALPVALPGAEGPSAGSPEPEEPTFNLATLFDWDLVSLEQNNPRFNGSVLSGFHSVRSPGVTPHRAWKTGLGVNYTREEQIAVASNAKLFNRQQLVLNPKINWGFLPALEAGVGFEGTFASGETVVGGPGGTVQTVAEDELAASAVDVGAKWRFLQAGKLRLALAFDSRIAIDRESYGSLSSSLYNVEIDGDFAFTPKWGLIWNVQYLTTDSFFDEDQVLLDLGTSYSFSESFRGMLFGTLQDDDEADNLLLFGGIAGQYVFEQHSFTLAFDFQLNEAERDVRTQDQLDVEFSYTFTF